MKFFNSIYQYTYLFLVIILSGISLKTNAQDLFPKYEERAVWLTTLSGLDWPSTKAQGTSSRQKQQRELCQILDKLKEGGVNTVIFQTRIRGTVVYPSNYEQWDYCLTGTAGKSPGYDPLKFAIDECHKRGMELHAWIVTIPLGKWNGTGAKNLRKKHPNLVIKVGDEAFMNPEVSETGNYIAKMCSEVVRNYDVDGIHLDYIRYPETWKKKLNKVQGRKYITSIVEKINKSVKSQKPWVKLTCSPIGKYDDLTRYSSRGWNARSRVCQDAQLWLRNNLMDGLYPMMYFNGNNFYPFALDWIENSYGKPIVSGLGIYFMRDKNWELKEIKRQMGVTRRYGIGHAYFRSRFFTDNLKGIYDFASRDFDIHPALPTPMTWQSKVCPTQPNNFKVNRFSTVDHLSWQQSTDRSGSDYIMYNIYASDTYPVDINDARNLVAAKVRQTEFSIKNPYGFSKNKHYAVTAINRFGNESAPAVSHYIANSTKGISSQKTLRMPILPNNLDVNYLVIEKNDGCIVSITPYYEQIDIQSFTPGIYVLKALGKKAVPHRIGWLKINKVNNQNSYNVETVWKK